jgi:energy-coupling factor transporter transmembrane protein EcfT
LHPVTRLALWGVWAVGVALAPVPRLLFLAILAAMAFLFARTRPAAWRLLRRSRWLFAMIALSYAFSVPGEPLAAALGTLSPTLEGLRAGGVHVVRLALMIVGVAVLLATTATDRLVYGLYALARPLRWLGVDRRTFAVRLGLTLEAVEAGTARADGLAALKEGDAPPPGPACYRLAVERWQWRDGAALLAALSLLWAGLS